MKHEDLMARVISLSGEDLRLAVDLLANLSAQLLRGRPDAEVVALSRRLPNYVAELVATAATVQATALLPTDEDAFRRAFGDNASAVLAEALR